MQPLRPLQLDNKLLHARSRRDKRHHRSGASQPAGSNLSLRWVSHLSGRISED